MDKLREELAASKNPDTLEDIQISAEAVLKELRSSDITKASGLDNIPGRLLKEGAIYLAKPLSDLFNVSLQTGSLPSDWKRANNKCAGRAAGTLLPTTALSVCIIHRKITHFLNEINQLYDYQHGFCTVHPVKHSC